MRTLSFVLVLRVAGCDPSDTSKMDLKSSPAKVHAERNKGAFAIA